MAGTALGIGVVGGAGINLVEEYSDSALGAPHISVDEPPHGMSHWSWLVLRVPVERV